MIIRFSPGVAQGCRELLFLSTKHSLSPSAFAKTFPVLSSLPLGRLLEVARGLQWANVDEAGHVTASELGIKLLKTTTYPHLLRAMLRDYIDVTKPGWLQSAPYGRAKVLRFVGEELEQVFVEANLVHGIDDETVKFWDSLAALARGLRDDRLTEIGREGERLSLLFEKNRTGNTPRWIAIETNGDGYDLLSRLSEDDKGALTVEVKSSNVGLSGKFHLTQNEWEHAISTIHHVFHLWDLRSPVPRVAVLSPGEIADHVPINSGSGSWESVAIPYTTFDSKFFEPSLSPESTTLS